MNDDDDSFAPDFFELVLLGLVILAAVVALGTCVTKARAQEHVLDDQLAVAILVVNEADLRVSPDELAAIVEVVRRRAARADMSVAAMAQRYGRTAFDRLRTQRPWVAHLGPFDFEPEDWPDSLAWAWKDTDERPAPSRQWQRIYRRVGEVIDGRVRHRCDRAPDHWGSPRIVADRLRAQRAVLDGRWVPVSCGNTSNDFFAVRWRRSRQENAAYSGSARRRAETVQRTRRAGTLRR